jgi:hypothetical protein
LAASSIEQIADAKYAVPHHHRSDAAHRVRPAPITVTWQPWKEAIMDKSPKTREQLEALVLAELQTAPRCAAVIA